MNDGEERRLLCPQGRVHASERKRSFFQMLAFPPHFHCSLPEPTFLSCFHDNMPPSLPPSFSWLQGKFFRCTDLSKMTEEECRYTGQGARRDGHRAGSTVGQSRGREHSGTVMGQGALQDSHGAGRAGGQSGGRESGGTVTSREHSGTVTGREHGGRVTGQGALWDGHRAGSIVGRSRGTENCGTVTGQGIVCWWMMALQAGNWGSSAFRPRRDTHRGPFPRACPAMPPRVPDPDLHFSCTPPTQGPEDVGGGARQPSRALWSDWASLPQGLLLCVQGRGPYADRAASP